MIWVTWEKFINKRYLILEKGKIMLDILIIILSICLIICLIDIFRLKNALEQSGFWQEYEHQEADENRRCYWRYESLILSLYQRKNNGKEIEKTQIKFNSDDYKLQAFYKDATGKIHVSSEKFYFKDFPFEDFEDETIIPQYILQQFKDDLKKLPLLITNTKVDAKPHTLKSNYKIFGCCEEKEK